MAFLDAFIDKDAWMKSAAKHLAPALAEALGEKVTPLVDKVTASPLFAPEGFKVTITVGRKDAA